MKIFRKLVLCVFFISLLLAVKADIWSRMRDKIKNNLGLGDNNKSTPVSQPVPTVPTVSPKTKEQIEKEIEEEIKLEFAKEVREQVLSLSSFKQDFSNSTSQIPELLGDMYSRSSLLDFSPDWSWTTDFDSTLKTEWRLRPEIEQQYTMTIKKAVDLAKESKLPDDILKSMVSDTAKLILSNTPRKCELAQSNMKIDTIISNLCKKAKAFNIDLFRSEIKDFLNKENKNLTAKEMEDLSIIILSSIDSVQKLTKNLNFKISEKILPKFKATVKESIANSNLGYDEIVSDINLQLQALEDAQFMSNFIKIKFQANHSIKENEPFRFKIDEIINAKRPDLELIELIPSSRAKPINYDVNSEDGLIDVLPDSISGTAPAVKGQYSYNIFVKLTSINNGSIE